MSIGEKFPVIAFIRAPNLSQGAVILYGSRDDVALGVEMVLRYQIERLLRAKIDRDDLLGKFEQLAYRRGFRELAHLWAVALYEHDARFFERFLIRHLPRSHAMASRLLPRSHAMASRLLPRSEANELFSKSSLSFFHIVLSANPLVFAILACGLLSRGWVLVGKNP